MNPRIIDFDLELFEYFSYLSFPEFDSWQNIESSLCRCKGKIVYLENFWELSWSISALWAGERSLPGLPLPAALYLCVFEGGCRSGCMLA